MQEEEERFELDQKRVPDAQRSLKDYYEQFGKAIEKKNICREDKTIKTKIEKKIIIHSDILVRKGKDKKKIIIHSNILIKKAG